MIDPVYMLLDQYSNLSELDGRIEMDPMATHVPAAYSHTNLASCENNSSLDTLAIEVAISTAPNIGGIEIIIGRQNRDGIGSGRWNKFGALRDFSSMHQQQLQE